ncbi:UvrD-helicase domain-containing protein [Pyrococcus kukulkanii]|uniref:UvrD-like helicase ATP-binding domain-containing protein n=1 Tax=Pyrococcus kukulkanii TaxID=1609559 RepID=A0A127BA21_9EURY|nr:UvrD-helicase domain-containing protein [Pyrococcus kukulkanii]AMM54182.1 hypothetical protein TQ32_06605 [Pyrococcus kukulkanii]
MPEFLKKLIGPPGTGKTRWIMTQILGLHEGKKKVLEEYGLEGALWGEELAFATLENSALRELLGRIGYEDRAGWMRTVDGIVIRALAIAGRVENPPNPLIFESVLLKVARRFRLNLELVKERINNFTYLINNLRVEEAKEYAQSDLIVGEWLKLLAEKGVKPFELYKLDLLNDVEAVRDEIVHAKTPHLLPKLMFVDEAQDLSRLDWLVLTRLFAESKFVIVGDDLQAIFSFRGADYRVFESIKAGRVEVLDKSYRLPQDIIDVAKAYIKRMVGKYYDFRAVDESKQAEFYILPPNQALRFAIELARKGFSVQILTRTSKTASELRLLLWSAGIFADDLAGSVLEKVERFRELLRLLAVARKKKAFTEEQEKKFQKLAWEFLRPDARQRVNEIFKQPALLRQGRLDQLLDLKNDDVWPDVLVAYLAYKQTPLKLYVDTMHAAKGTESDYTVIWGDFHRRAPDPGEEARVVYVAITRARKGIIIDNIMNPYLIPLLDILNEKVDVKTQPARPVEAEASP